MRQGQFEPNNSSLQRFNSNIKTVEMANGNHIFCATEIMEKEGADPTLQEVRIEEEIFKVILFLKRSDEGRYKGLMNSLQESSWLGKDEYQLTLAGMYTLLARHSGQIGNRTQKDCRSQGGRARGTGQN